jgi:hypothetical protein
VCTVYQIVRDIFIKHELDEIEIIDGVRYGRPEYFIRAISKMSRKSRLMIPFHLDGEIDLEW